MGKNAMMIVMILQILIFAAAILSNKWDKKPVHYFILFVLSSILLTHIFAYNTDSEDIYISLRYVKNFVEGKGLVFNTFDKVEGYSDFLWVMLIAGIHKVLHTDIPMTARYLSVVFSVITMLYTFYLSLKFTGNRLLSYMAAFLVSISGSFACYGLAGLENPLYGLFILLIIQVSYLQKWWIAGLLVGLVTMTRPEGFVMFFPVALYIFLQNFSTAKKIQLCLLVGAIAAIPVVPWTAWRVWYYGYLIPNTIAAKEGMDLMYQLKIGVTYSAYFLLIICESLLLLLLIPVINLLSNKNLKNFIKDPLLITLLFTALIFILFYTYAGGDWMPGWRFYASLVPLFSLIIMMLWNGSVFQTNTASVWRSSWIVLVFAFCGYIQVRNSFMNDNLIPLVRFWYHEVEGLKYLGKWFHKTLPRNTLLATFPNGAFSYYNELPTIDYGGLTDNNVGRFGKKKKIGRPGHITENVEYVLSKRPDIIAIMDGQGFVQYIQEKSPFPGYESATFSFTNYDNAEGKYVNINIRTDKVQEVLNYLLAEKNVQLIKLTRS